jgi:hypothetical protein
MLQKSTKAQARTLLAAQLGAERKAAQEEDARKRAEDPEFAALAARREALAAEREIARVEKRLKMRIQRAGGLSEQIEDLDKRARACTEREPKRAANIADKAADVRYELNELRRAIAQDEDELKAKRKAAASR